MYTAYMLTEETITTLKSAFQTVFPDFIGHHITVRFGVSNSEPIPQFVDKIHVVGEAIHDGVQALLVSIDGNTIRGDGGSYHITWSIDRSKGKKPVDSNRIIQLARMVAPIKIEAIPALLL